MIVAYGPEENPQGVWVASGRFMNTDGHRFALQNKNVYEIYHGDNLFNPNSNFNDLDDDARKKPIGRLINQRSNVVKYIYHDSNDNEHFICELNKFITIGKENGIHTTGNYPTYLPSYRRAVNVAEGLANNVITPQDLTPQQLQDYTLIQNTISYDNFQNEGVDARISYVFTNGVITKGYGNDFPDRFYENTNSIELVYAQHGEDLILETINNFSLFEGINYIHDDVKVRFGFYKTRRRYSNPDFLAAVIGSLADCNFEEVVSEHAIDYRGIISEGFSYEDGTCFPSTSHANGKAFDTNYLISETLEDLLTNAMRFYGIDYQGRGVTGWKPSIDHSQYLARHEGHLHSGGRNFNQNFIENILE